MAHHNPLLQTQHFNEVTISSENSKLVFENTVGTNICEFFEPPQVVVEAIQNLKNHQKAMDRQNEFALIKKPELVDRRNLSIKDQIILKLKDSIREGGDYVNTR